MRDYINEGLKKNDLDQLVLPLLSIDEYASKINDAENIVVGFYVFEQPAAEDLANFVERSPYNVQDTDVSPAPTTDGYYVTFIELQRSGEFVDDLINLLDEVSRITNVEDWQFSCPKLKKDEIENLNKKTLEKYIDLKAKTPKQKEIEECFEFFKNSSLTNVCLEENQLILEKFGTKVIFIVESFDNGVPRGILNLDKDNASRCIVLEKFLCGNYFVNSIGDNGTLIIESSNTNKYLCVRPV